MKKSFRLFLVLVLTLSVSAWAQDDATQFENLEKTPAQEAMLEGMKKATKEYEKLKNFKEQQPKALKTLLEIAPQRLKDFYQEHKAWLEENTEDQKRLLHIAEGLFNIANDKKIQTAILELLERFKFKPLILAEVLFLILTLVFRSTRPQNRGIFVRLLEQFLISNVYVLIAVIGIPTLFLGTSYPYLLWTIGQRVIQLFYPGFSPLNQ